MTRPAVLAVIPARGGSKGLPGKNIRPFAGKPLIAHTIDAARACRGIDRICVTTDDDGIRAVCEAHGVRVPWLRPPHLATDEAAVVDAVIHALDRLRDDEGYEPSAVVLLQPTSPFRTTASLHAALTMFAAAQGESVVAVTPAREHPYWMRRIGARGELVNPWTEPEAAMPRQQLPPFHRLAGSIYVAPVRIVRETRSFYAPVTRALVVPPREAIDIDTIDDWEYAEYLAAHESAQGGEPV